MVRARGRRADDGGTTCVPEVEMPATTVADASQICCQDRAGERDRPHTDLLASIDR